MQGIVCAPHNLQTGSPPPQNTTDPNMDTTSKPNQPTKDQLSNQSNQSDSGIFSTTINSTFPEDSSVQTNSGHCSDADNLSDRSSPDRKYFCPICKTTLTSQHDFTLHIRSHNAGTEVQDADKGFLCRICNKVLSSSSSLDRHVLVHSGERPFACKYCGDTFTTNGNMHRHVRTHSHKNYESDEGSTDDSSGTSLKNVEFNNNKIEVKYEKRKMEEDEEEEDNKHRKKLSEPPDNRQIFKCPVCERTDFNSLFSFETHLEDNHPDYPANCNHCNRTFPNNKLLNAHRNIAHNGEETAKNTKNFVTGFKDLIFVDFSSEKFPHIARYQCEKNIHKVSSGLKFQCQKCSRAFPCVASLEIHEKACEVGLDLSARSEGVLNLSESEIRRADFFSRLDLLNNSPEKERREALETSVKLLQQQQFVKKTVDNGKDLADIQSIISNTTNGTLLQHMQHPKIRTPNSDHLHETPKIEQEEESQDLFATEFRKMKLRGEFPCRLCTAVFPNLRALKGHNRTHLNSTTNGTYHCNMCPHSSVDKAALIRHMRTHNGDRPYECSLCNYAFTTKANCERHLRNRHAKTTREEVKKSIIYHPSEDPTNDEVNKLGIREDGKKLNASYSMMDGDLSPSDKVRCSTPKLPLLPEFRNTIISENIPKPDHRSIPDITELIHTENLKSLKDHRIIRTEQLPPYVPPPLYTPSPNLSTRIQVKNLDSLKGKLDFDSHPPPPYQDDEQPMDLVLDLSTKKPEPSEPDEPDVPQDLSKKSGEQQLSMDKILAQQLLKNTPKLEPHNFYNQLAFYNRLNLPNWPGFPFNHLMMIPSLQASLLPPQDHQELKERLQRHLVGGGMVDNFAENLKNFPGLHNHPVMSAFNNGLKPTQELESFREKHVKPSEELKPLSLNMEQIHADNLNKMHSPVSQVKPELISSPNSVKMVIKNGVLMPKQKQRRYRTERPFSCEHCSARFTLRSNMERHIKQQHPQFWSQRQRSSIGNPGRKAQIYPANMKNNYCDLSIPNYELPKMQDAEETKEHVINDKLKYAILAHQLRNTQSFKTTYNAVKKEEDEDCDLVIDEKEENAIKTETKYSEDCKLSEEKLKSVVKSEEGQDLVPVSRLLDNASQQQFKEYFRRDGDEHDGEGISEEDEEGLVASGSTSEGNNSGTDENRSESENVPATDVVKKKSAYSLAPNRVSCPYCSRKFPWTSSLRRHILTHTGQKPFKCSHCPLLFTTKSNCDRHLLRKHGNSATTINNDANANISNANYLMRNVPERPYKCSNCPSSTFSTYSNLKKHISCKHSNEEMKAQGYEAGVSSEDEKVVSGEQKNDWDNQIAATTKIVPSSDAQLQNSDLPFKCHLCERSFAERQDALDHIKLQHASEYDLLMSKNALDSSAVVPDDATNHDEEDSEIRGKFPDYSNRKVICAFCMRRFWSAEDLRRHMRTHTGERPFSCDICRRRFTLKHSMLRHRKKHNVAFEVDNANSDEDGGNNAGENNNVEKPGEKTDESDGNEGDLISNLLGLKDKSILDQVLTASADDAAKLLGVKNGLHQQK